MLRRATWALLFGALLSCAAYALTPQERLIIFSKPYVAASSGLSCSYTPVTSATYNVAYTGATPSASGGTPAYTFSQTGSLPPGMSINSSTGVISGTDTVDSGGATYPGIQVKVTDSLSTVANCGMLFTITVAPAGYTGPLDVISGANAWWGVRCATAAYSGNVADIADSATGNTTGTRLKCDGAGNVVAVVSSSACTFVTGNACSPLATTCATACNVNRLYDQSGQTNCSSAACDLTDPTNSARPTLVANCITTRYCIQFSGAQVLYNASTFATVAQPYSVNVVAVRTGAAVFSRLMEFATGLTLLQYSSANIFGISGGTNLLGTAADNTMFGFMCIFNNTSSAVYKNASSIASGAAGVNSSGGVIGIGAANSGLANPFTGNFTEGGLWSGDQTSSAAALNTNQQAYYGY